MGGMAASATAKRTKRRTTATLRGSATIAASPSRHFVSVSFVSIAAFVSTDAFVSVVAFVISDIRSKLKLVFFL